MRPHESPAEVVMNSDDDEMDDVGHEDYDVVQNSRTFSNFGGKSATNGNFRTQEPMMQKAKSRDRYLREEQDEVNLSDASGNEDPDAIDELNDFRPSKTKAENFDDSPEVYSR